MVSITSDFDHGNIRVLSDEDPQNITLEIAPDTAADFYQWFHFRVSGAAGEALTMRITNASGASYARGWDGYQTVASYDGETWFRVETQYENGVLSFQHTPDQDAVHYAYFAAYPASRIGVFAKSTAARPPFRHAVIGKSLDGQDIHYFSAGDGLKQLWVIARQHPGETMGSWWMEGFVDAIAENGAAVDKLLHAATLHIIPCMNPDGARRGHLRTNAAGVDLNRAWRNTTMDKSPEVFLVRDRMRETGVDFFLDVHGDEMIPNNFLDSANGVPSWSTRHKELFDAFSSKLLSVSRDFQTKDGYPPSPPGKANLDIANKYVAETWGCLSMTLEMPFKDANINPVPESGWSPERCRTFAREHLSVIADMVNALD